MSSPRVQKIFEAMPDQIKRLGGYTFDIRQVIRWQGRVTAGAQAGKDAMVLDLTAAAWADNNLRAILIATPASDLNHTQAMLTQSHASGNFVDGSVRFQMYLETPEAWTDAQAQFGRIMQQHLVGQLGAPTEILYSANDTEPTVQGVNGASSTASFTSAGTLLPWGMTYPGGV